ncbi:MAG: glycosyltransferase family 39 protein [Acidobacteriaceae bacterium]
MTAENAARTIPVWVVLPAIFVAVVAAHAALLHLPYYWDEAGYYIPAAYDFFRTGALVPYSTLSNAHPPLPSVYLAVWWEVFHFAPVVTRTAMCAVAAVALTAVWRLALITTGKAQVAAATVLLTGIYPVFFAQSSLAHADLFAAAGTLWALAFFLEGRIWLAAICFSLAALSKETAIVTPLALAVWEVFRIPTSAIPTSAKTGQSHSAHLLRRFAQARIWGTRDWWKGRIGSVVALVAPVVPLAGWYAYHWRKTGFVFGNAEYVRYNATETLTPVRVLLALAHRTMHVTAHMNLFVPVAAMLACLLLPVVKEDSKRASAESGQIRGTQNVGDSSQLRARIGPGQQAVFYVTIAANVVFFSLLGGALLTRYLLPVYPLVLLLCVSTFRRRLREWAALVALSAAAFVAGLFVNPPYRFASEDNLEYATVIRLHEAAVAEIVAQMPGATVLTAWPATDELTKPELGYVQQPVRVMAIENFSAEQIAKAATLSEDYSAALVFSTKYDPPRLWLSLGKRNEELDARYFDFHRDLPPGMIARALGGRVVWRAERKGQWAAVLRFARTGPSEARQSW